MWPYWFLFSIPAFFALSQINQEKAHINPMQVWTWDWSFTFITIALMVGFRYQVGGDWGSYLDKIQNINFSFWIAVFEGGDPAYNLLNWMSLFFGGIFFVNFICGLIFSYGLLVYCRTLAFPWLGITVAIPYLVMVVAMGYSRQGVAIGVVMLGLAAIQDGKIVRYISYVGLACLFHVSAIVMMPIIAPLIKKRRWLMIPFLSMAVYILYTSLVSEKVDSFTHGYLDAAYESSGAKIRVWMNVVPSILFLWIRNRIPISQLQKQFWTLMSLGGIATIFALEVSTSSTAVDRVALYWIPIQLYVFSWVPVAFKKIASPSIWILLVVVYSATIQFVWLNYAQTAFAWLPYQFYTGFEIF